MGIGRLITGSVGTLLVGMLAGFVLASAAGVVVQDSGLFGASGESPIARAYMLGLIQRDPNSIVGTYSVHIYAVGLRSSQGVDQFFPLALTVSGGKVVRSE